MLKIGLLGAGFMGMTHAEVYKLLSFGENVKICGVYDTDRKKAEKAARLSFAKVFDSADELINSDEIDAIDICLPTYLHFEYAKKVIEAGKHLFIEKPVVLKPQEADELIELKSRYNKEVMVGQCLRLWDEYVILKEIFDSKRYGKLKHLTMKRLSQMPDWGFENWYLDYNKSGGVLLDLHIHDVDFMRYLLGEPESLMLSGDYNHVYTIFKYQGLDVQIESGWDFPKSFPVEVGYRADFEDAVVSYNGKDVVIYENSGSHFTVEDKAVNPNDHLLMKAKQYQGYYNELKYFCECILNNKEIEINTLTEGAKTVELIYKEISNV